MRKRSNFGHWKTVEYLKQSLGLKPSKQIGRHLAWVTIRSVYKTKQQIPSHDPQAVLISARIEIHIMERPTQSLL